MCNSQVINIPAIDTWTDKELNYPLKKNKIKCYTKMTREQKIEAVKAILKNIKES